MLLFGIRRKLWVRKTRRLLAAGWLPPQPAERYVRVSDQIRELVDWSRPVHVKIVPDEAYPEQLVLILLHAAPEAWTPAPHERFH